MLAPQRKAMTNLDSILKSGDITLPTSVHLVKAMVFPVVMYGCESWTIKKAEYWRTDAFELWCWRRFFLFLILIFTLFFFTILYWFCHTLTWIHHGCTCVPKHEPSSYLPPHNISLGHPRAPAPSMLYPASDTAWWFDSYMIVYMFQCHSPKSSHPLPLPLSPKVRSTHLYLFCCLAYRVVITLFLNSIYMC